MFEIPLGHVLAQPEMAHGLPVPFLLGRLMLSWEKKDKNWWAVWDETEVDVFHDQKVMACVRRDSLAVNGDVWFAARKWDDFKLAVEEVWQAMAHFKKTGQTPLDQKSWTPEKIRRLLQCSDERGYVPKAKDLEEGSWECEGSPTHICWYNSIEDPCWDDCLFCGEPDERK